MRQGVQSPARQLEQSVWSVSIQSRDQAVLLGLSKVLVHLLCFDVLGDIVIRVKHDVLPFHIQFALTYSPGPCIAELLYIKNAPGASGIWSVLG
jgi:hypothetical protein